MELNKEELRRLADAAGSGEWGRDGSYVCTVRREGETTYVESWRAVAECPQPEVVKFIAAANPAAILSLLDENDRLLSTIIRTSVRHFSLEIKDRTDERKLDECLAEGISILEAERDQLRAENESLRERADKYAAIERVMEMLKCDEREGGIWTACTLLLIGSSHGMNSARSTVDQEGVDIAGENIGDWRVTVERLSAMDKERNSNP